MGCFVGGVFFYYLCFLVLVFVFFFKVSQTSIWLGRCKEAAFLVLNLTYQHLGFFYLYLVFIFLKDFPLSLLFFICDLFGLFLMACVQLLVLVCFLFLCVRLFLNLVS